MGDGECVAGVWRDVALNLDLDGLCGTGLAVAVGEMGERELLAAHFVALAAHAQVLLAVPTCTGSRRVSIKG